MKTLVYDIETFKNMFTFTAMNVVTEEIYYYEMSDRRNDSEQLRNFVMMPNTLWVGFNNIGFDYPVMHHFITHAPCSVEELYRVGQDIINAPYTRKFKNVVPARRWYMRQLDLYLLHGFDSPVRAISLKTCAFNLRLGDITTLPFNVDAVLNDDDMAGIEAYNKNDVRITLALYEYSADMLKLRDSLTRQYQRDFTNLSDIRIGPVIMEQELIRAGVMTNRKYRQSVIDINDLIIDTIKFDTVEFNNVLTYFKTCKIDSGNLKNVLGLKKFKRDRLTYSVGAGGLHASVRNKMYCTDREQIIIDLDVVSYYPTLACVNKFYPQCWGEKFVNVYNKLLIERRHSTGITNTTLKLALNCVYGNSNNPYSIFYDPEFTLAITINGQLLLLMLIDKLLSCNTEVIQANTDGITIYVRRSQMTRVDQIIKQWEKLTGLQLKRQPYREMFIKDVNNYIAVSDAGVKRIGAYSYTTTLDGVSEPDVKLWGKHSQLIVPKIAAKCLLYYTNIKTELREHANKLDFLMLAKVRKNCMLVCENEEGTTSEIGHLVRCYASNTGVKLFKIMPPLAGKTNIRKSVMFGGTTVTLLNKLSDIDDINYDYYAGEIAKLVLIYE